MAYKEKIMWKMPLLSLRVCGRLLFESKAHSTISVAHFTGFSQFLNRKIQEI